MKKLVLAIAIFASLPQFALSATRYWDVNGITTGSGANGTTNTWDTGTTANWNSSSAGTSAATTWANNDSARISAGTDGTSAFTVNVSGTIQVNQIGVEEGDPTFTGGTLNFTHAVGGTSLLTGIAGGEANVTITMNSQVSGTNGFRMARSTVAGTHILNLNNTANNFTGGLFINSGQTINSGASGVIPDSNVVTFSTTAAASTLDLAGFNETVAALSQASGTASSLKLGSATLTLASPSGESYVGVISGTGGSVVKNGSGVQDFAAANTFTGGLTLNNGTIRAGNNAALGAANSAVTVGATSGTIASSSSTARTLTYAYTLNGDLTLGQSTGGTGAVTLAGTVDLGGATRTVSVASSTAAISAPISNGNLTKAGTGALGLSGANTGWDGDIVVAAGRVDVQNANALGTTVGDTEVQSGAELRVDGAANSYTIAEPIKIAGTGAGGGGAITVQNSSVTTFSGPVTLTGDAQVTVSGSATATYSNANAITGVNRNLTVQGGSGAGGGGLISGVIDLGTGSLTKLQGGKWVLTGANVYSGGTTVGAGTLLANNTTGSATGSGDVNVTGGTLGGTGAIAGNVIVAGGTLAAGASIGTLNIGGDLTLTSGSLDWEFNTTALTADLTNVAGALSIASAVTLSGVNLGAAAILNGTKFTVISYATAGSPGTFSGMADDSVVLIGGQYWVINYNDTPLGSVNGGAYGNAVTLTAVPELTSLLTVGLAGVFAFGAIRLGKRFGFSFKV